MKTRYFIFLSYSGSSYFGWQIQPEAVSVQGVLDKGLSTLLNEEIKTTGAGRTDTGVHAAFFCAHFESVRSDLATDPTFMFRLNRFLPRDISISAIRTVRPDAHARFSALSRTYKYYVSRTKDPFCGHFSWYIYGSIDVEKMNEACEKLLSHSDFTSFSRLHSGAKTNICRITAAGWKEEDDKLIFTIRADRFLRNMVRAIVGTMIDIGQGKTSVEEFEAIIESKDRCRAGKSAPATGLFLTAIEYPEEIYL